MTSYTLDTCALIYIYEHPNVGGLVACRFDSSKSNFYVCSMNKIELERKGYDFYDVVIRVQQNIAAKIIVEDITSEIMDNAEILSCGCNVHPLASDNQCILPATLVSSHFRGQVLARYFGIHHRWIIPRVFC